MSPGSVSAQVAASPPPPERERPLLRDDNQDSMDDAALTTAIAITKDILSHLAINRVIFVDDEARPRNEVTPEEVTAALRDGIVDPARLAAETQPGMTSVLVDDTGTALDPDTAADLLDAWWLKADKADQDRVLAAYRDLAKGTEEGASTEVDAVAVSSVQRLMPKGVDFRALLPSEWVELLNTGKLVTKRGSALKQPKTLVLFDRDLSKARGFRDDQGEAMLAQLLKHAKGEHCYAALVSHWVAIEQEPAHWAKVAAERDLAQHRFTVISKQRIVGDPVEFARRIRAMLLAPGLTEMAGEVADGYIKAVAEASDALVGLSLPALEQAVLGSALEEGVWEPDILLRLVEAHVRDTIRGRLRSSPRMHELVEQLRDAASVRGTGDEPGPDELWRMQRREAYSDFLHLSTLRLALEPGDVLRVIPVGGAPVAEWVRAEDEPYLLVTEQDCDLHIRAAGRRNRNPERLAVVPVQLAEPGGNEVFCLPWFCPGTGRQAFAVLNRERGLPALALDLAAIGEGGFASLTLGSPAPDTLIPTWEKRHEVLTAQTKQILTDYAALTTGADPATAAHVLMSLTLATRDTELAVEADVEAGTLAFGLQRVGRLLPPWRTEVLQRLGQLPQRVPYEGDLVRRDRSR